MKALKKILFRVAVGFGAVVALLAAAAFLLAWLGSRPMSADAYRKALRESVAAIRGKNPRAADLGLTVDLPSLGIREAFGADAEEGRKVFHAASVGKLFAAVAIGRLFDSGRLSPDDKAAAVLDPGTLDGLFVFGGVDRQAEVTVAQLLAHTSGAADHFADPARGGKTVEALIAEDPGRAWTPRDLVDFSRNEQAAVGAPGERFHYSDTGYVLLGLIAERLYGLPYHEVLAREVFGPAGMADSYMPRRSLSASGAEPAMRAAWLGSFDASRAESITADWAGGGVATTADDLVAFARALWGGKLVSAEVLARMSDCRASFAPGIRYGEGMMELRFGEFFPLLADLPPLRGHMGVLGIHLFHDPVSGATFVASFNATGLMPDGVRLIIEAWSGAQRVRN